MNCKPGDLALIVRDKRHPVNLGKFVTVIGVGPRSEPNEWLIDPASQLVVDIDLDGVFGGVEVVGPGEPDIYFLDEELFPIRHPGDDTRDNAWDWLPPVPNDISAEDPQDLREALKQWSEEQR